MDTGKSLIRNAKIAKSIAESVVNGQTQREIAEDYGVSRHTISKALKTNEIKALVEKTYNDIVSLAPKVYDIYADEITRTPATAEDRKLRVAVARDVASISGISPIRDSRSSVFLQQILAPVSVSLSPVVELAIARLLGPAEPSDIIDVEPLD